MMSQLESFSDASPAFQLMIATSWLSPESCWGRQERAIRLASENGLDWFEYLRLVDRHRIPALSWASLNRVSGINIPQPLEQELRRRSDACRWQAIAHLQVLTKILQAFNREGIPVMPLKGPLLSLELYGDVGLRHSKDLDILVPEDALLGAEHCLSVLGWQRCEGYSGLSPRQWNTTLRRDFHIKYIDPSGLSLELHWRTKGDTVQLTADRWRRSVSNSWHGCFYQVMNPIDLALYLCDHGADHAWFRAKWLGDMARVHTSGNVGWDNALERARELNQERALGLCFWLLKEAHKLPIPTYAESSVKGLPQALIAKAIRDIRNPGESPHSNLFARAKEQIRCLIYERLLWPHRSSLQIISDRIYSPREVRRRCYF